MLISNGSNMIFNDLLGPMFKSIQNINIWSDS